MGYVGLGLGLDQAGGEIPLRKKMGKCFTAAWSEPMESGGLAGVAVGRGGAVWVGSGLALKKPNGMCGF